MNFQDSIYIIEAAKAVKALSIKGDISGQNLVTHIKLQISYESDFGKPRMGRDPPVIRRFFKTIFLIRLTG